MLAKSIFIYSPSALGGGKYSLQAFFADSVVPKYVALGDYIEDKVGRQYEVVSPTVIPVTDGATLTVQFVTADALPTQDSSFDSIVFTPDQIDFEPEVRVAGQITTASVYDASNYEYEVEANWDVPSIANKAVVGDSVVDAAGKEFTISHLESGLFGEPFRIIEVEKTISNPTVGIATLYRPTDGYHLFRGSELTDAARTRIRTRDQKIIDTEIKESASDTYRQHVHTLTSQNITEKKVTLPSTPIDPTEVSCDIDGGVKQLIGDDFTVTGNEFSWNGLGMDGLVEEGEVLIIEYYAKD